MSVRGSGGKLLLLPSQKEGGGERYLISRISEIEEFCEHHLSRSGELGSPTTGLLEVFPVLREMVIRLPWGGDQEVKVKGDGP